MSPKFNRLTTLFSIGLAFTVGYVSASTIAKPSSNTPFTTGCGACASNCILDKGEFLIRDKKSDLKTLTCQDFDQDGTPHCCRTEVQANYICVMQPPSRVPATVGACDRPYCPGATPTDIVCGSSQSSNPE